MTGDSSPTAKITYPRWEPEFQAALLELDCEKLLERIELAEGAILGRIQAIGVSTDGDDERRAMGVALSSLTALKLIC